MQRRARRQEDPAGVKVTAATELTTEARVFLHRGWSRADHELFGREMDWTSRAVVVQARAGRQLVGVASGEAVAGMARLHDLFVAEEQRGRGVGSELVGEFCALAAGMGAERCFLRCPDTARHRRFYERAGFVQVARIPRYYHGHDFLEYLREPLT